MLVLGAKLGVALGHADFVVRAIAPQILPRLHARGCKYARTEHSSVPCHTEPHSRRHGIAHVRARRCTFGLRDDRRDSLWICAPVSRRTDPIPRRASATVVQASCLFRFCHSSPAALPVTSKNIQAMATQSRRDSDMRFVVEND